MNLKIKLMRLETFQNRYKNIQIKFLKHYCIFENLFALWFKKFLVPPLKLLFTKELLSKFLISLFSIFLLILIVLLGFKTYESIKTPSISLSRVTLPQELINSGISPEMMSQRIIKIANDINKELISEDKLVAVMQNIYHKQKINTGICLNQQYPLPDLFKSIAKESSNQINNTIGKSRTVIPKLETSTDDIIDLAKELLGYASTNIQFDIAKLANEYTVYANLINSGRVVDSSQMLAKNLEEIDQKAALLLLKYSNPAAFASAMAFENPEGVEESVKTYRLIHPEEVNNSKFDTLMGFIALNRQQQAWGIVNPNMALLYFTVALNKNSQDTFAQVGKAIANVKFTEACFLIHTVNLQI
jgi:hypothetical protein